MLYKHLFTLLSTSFLTFNALPMEEIVIEKPINNDQIALYACTVLKVKDKKTEAAIKSLFVEKQTDTKEKKEERRSIFYKLSESLEKK